MLKDKRYLAKGKRSIVYKGTFKGKEAVMKQVKETAPPNIIKNEIKWLKKLEKYKIGPKLYKEGENYMICEFVKGKQIIEWVEEHDKKQVQTALKKILQQCRILDKLKVNKKELQKPLKHIIISRTVKMIDFERCKETRQPKNVTQFCQFITSKNMEQIISKKGIRLNKKKMIKILQKYKKQQTDQNFKKIISYVLK